ncbi:putative Ig domain-containing protein [Hymenobacter properus]|uniref:T9SS type A sorting domain-containing protein n=1 Tax=Hymenobacter properus TaxID=2791026 RepID=A0A931FL25_9BACT|nr:putative Ig domain-containing protein [Hymenobacter properus]MBF9143698.1 T9SS type A sorting domain-containing protein [Hymenobacter properus]MBR7722511.1 T9SS type A sorting domain-containing protein [Microvirga sp. SRT04]
MKQFDSVGRNFNARTWGLSSWSRFAGWRVLVLCLLFGMTAAAPAQASHFRYGSLTWRTVAADPSKRTVEFRVSQAWRASFGGLNPSVGSSVVTGQLEFGDGTNAPINLGVTSVDVVGDSFYGEATITHTYAAAGDFGAYYTDCCRLSTLTNNSNGVMYVSTLVNAGSGNSSPVSTLVPVMNLAVGQTAATFRLPASDPDGDALTYTMATASDFNGNPFANAPGMTVNASTGVVSFNTVGLTVGQMFNAVVKVSDGRTSILVDFLVKVTASSTPPMFDYSITPPHGYVYQVAPGQAVNFSVRALDSDAGDVVNLQTYGAPSAAGTAPALPLNANPVQTAFSWTPTAANLGTTVITFVAQDLSGVQAVTSVTVEVTQRPRFDVPPTPANRSTVQVTPGTALRYTIQASDPDATDRVTLASVTGMPTGASFGPAIPTAAANPVSTQLSWTPAVADWGPHAATFVARDTHGDQATHQLNFLINSAPSFTSQPGNLTLVVGRSFAYTITTTDPDLPYGDRLDVLAPTLPSWLHFVSNGNGTATLSGTPTAAQIGAHPVTLAAEDIYHHGNSYGAVLQSFIINVVGCSTAAVATPTQPACAGSTGSIALTVSGAVAPVTYAWTGPNRFQASTQNLTGVPAGTYTVVATDANGCTATTQATLTAPAPTKAPTVTVTLASAPVFADQPNTIFLGYGPQTATLTATGGVSYTWSPAAGLSNASVANPVFATVAAGQYTYTVTATNASGCTASATVTLTVVNASCGNNPKNPKVLVCHNGHEICISPNAVAAHIGPGSNHNDYLGSCAGVSAPAPVVTMSAFPNPVATATTVNFRTPVTMPASVRVYNQMGGLVTTLFEGEAVGGLEYQLEVNAATWPAGLYLCQFVGKGQTSTQRLMVNK